MRALTAALAAACAPAVWGQAPEFSLDVSYQEDRPVDRVLARVDADSDSWIGERDYEAINSELKTVARSLIEDHASFEPLAGMARRFSRLELVEFKIVSTGGFLLTRISRASRSGSSWADRHPVEAFSHSWVRPR